MGVISQCGSSLPYQVTSDVTLELHRSRWRSDSSYLMVMTRNKFRFISTDSSPDSQVLPEIFSNTLRDYSECIELIDITLCVTAENQAGLVK